MGLWTRWNGRSGNPLHYKGYEEKVEALQEKTGLDEAVVTGKARINGNEAVLAVCDGRFYDGEHGERWSAKRLPVQ